jgi:hypothetical protein
MKITVDTDQVTAEIVALFSIIFTVLAIAATVFAASKQEAVLSVVLGINAFVLMFVTRFSFKLVKSTKVRVEA